MKSMRIQRRITTVLATSAAAFALAACGQANDEMTVGEHVDSAIENTQSAAASVNQDMGKAIDQARQATGEMADNATAAVADATITAQVNAALAADDTLKALQINVDTKAGRVTMTGPAPDATARERATVLARAVEGVVDVDNRLVVAQGAG